MCLLAWAFWLQSEVLHAAQFKVSVCIPAHVCARKFGPRDSKIRGFHFSSPFLFFWDIKLENDTHFFTRQNPKPRQSARTGAELKKTYRVCAGPSKWGKSSTSRAGELRLLLFFVQNCRVAPRENRWVNSKRRVVVFKRRKPQPEGIFFCAGVLRRTPVWFHHLLLFIWAGVNEYRHLNRSILVHFQVLVVTMQCGPTKRLYATTDGLIF